MVVQSIPKYILSHAGRLEKACLEIDQKADSVGAPQIFNLWHCNVVTIRATTRSSLDMITSHSCNGNNFGQRAMAP
jgi:hypothetical protein